MGDGGPDGPGREIVYREVHAADAERIAEIDRTESVAMLHEVRCGEILPLDHGCKAPQWSGARLDETIAFVRRHLEGGATALGAFSGERLAGIGILGHAPVRGDALELQLAFLHVGRESIAGAASPAASAGSCGRRPCVAARGARTSRPRRRTPPSASISGWGRGWQNLWVPNCSPSNLRTCIWC